MTGCFFICLPIWERSTEHWVSFFGNMVPFLGEEGGFKKGTGGFLRKQGGNEGSNPANHPEIPFCIYRLTALFSIPKSATNT